MSEPTQAIGSKVAYRQKALRKTKEEQGSLLMKRVTQESDEEMKDVEGSRKRRAMSEVNSSVEAGD